MPFKFTVTVVETIERTRDYTVTLTKKEVVDYSEIPFEDQVEWQDEVARYLEDHWEDLKDDPKKVEGGEITDEQIDYITIDNVEEN